MSKSSASRKINSIMAGVSSDNLQTGKSWYAHAHSEAEILAAKYGRSIESVTGIIAVLSPGTRWEQNLVDAENVLRDGEAGGVTTYTSNKVKALRILAGENSFDVVHGRKVTPFFINILDPSDNYHVTIDRWILRAVGIIDAKEQKQVFACEKKYNSIADIFRRKAKDYGMLPCQLQAVVWEHTRKGED